MRAVALLLLVPLAGCAAPDATCEAPATADASRSPYDVGVVLHTLRGGTTVQAWACNDAGEDRWLLVRGGDCPGSWTWTYTPAGANAPEAVWPPQTNYGACTEWHRIADGATAFQTLALDVPHAPGGEWLIRLQVYTQAEMLQDAGGGPVHAAYET